MYIYEFPCTNFNKYFNNYGDEVVKGLQLFQSKVKKTLLFRTHGLTTAWWWLTQAASFFSKTDSANMFEGPAGAIPAQNS